MKRLLSLLTVIVMLASLMVGCTQPTPQQSSAPAEPQTSQEDTEDTTEEEDTEDTTEEDTDAPEEESAEDAEEEDAEEDTAPATGEPPEDPLGVVEVKPEDPIIIGYGLLTSGPNSNLGIDSMRGVEIALEDMGGELLGHEIQLVGEDTGCSPEGGQSAANKLISNEQIVAIIGSTCSSAGNVMAPVIDEAGMVMISPSNTAPNLTDPATHVQGYLRTAHNDKVQGAVAAEFAYEELGLKNAATIHDGSVYAEQLANVFAEKFEELGGTVVAQEAVNETDTDMKPVLTRIASMEPDLIYYPIFMPAGGFMTRQAREVDGLEEVTLMGADGLFNPDYIEAAGDATIGMYLSSPDLTSFGGGYQEFLDKHMETYNEDTLSVYHANAYDATMLIFEAIKQAAKQSEDGTLYIPRQGIRDALYSIQNYQGLTGSLTCNEHGDCADPKIVVYEIADYDPETWAPGDPAEDPDANPKKVYAPTEEEAAEGEEPADMDATDEMTATDDMDAEDMDATDEMTATDDMDAEDMDATDDMTATDDMDATEDDEPSDMDATDEMTTTIESEEVVSEQAGVVAVAPEGWMSIVDDMRLGAIMMMPSTASADASPMIVLSAGPVEDIPLEDPTDVSADSILDAMDAEDEELMTAEERMDVEIDGLPGRAVDITMDGPGGEMLIGQAVAVVVDDERGFTAMGVAMEDEWDQDLFDEVLASIQFVEPTATEADAEDAEEDTGDAEEDTGDAEVELEIVTEPPKDALGVIEVAPSDPIVIGYGLVTSGPNSNLGIDSMRGVEIALDDVKGTLLGYEIQLVGEDTGCSPEGGQTAANKLISNEQIVGIIGSTCSSAGNVMAPVIDEAGMVMISPSNTAPNLTDPATHVEGYLRTAHNDKVQGAVAAEFAYKELGLKNAATIHDGSVYAEQLANVFAEKFEELGGTVVAQEAVNETDTDMKPVLTRIASMEPDLIYYPIFMPAGGFMTRQAREVDGLEEITLMGADGLFNPDYIEAAGEATVGMYLSSPDLTSLGGAYQDFLDKHMDKYNEDTLSVYHANAYDATMLIFEAIKQAAKQSEDGTLYIPRQGIRDALYSIQNYQGLTGSLTCNEHGDCADPKIVVYEIADYDPETWAPGDPAEDPDANPKKVYPVEE